MVADFDDSTLLDEAGDEIGKVERTYVDDAGNARYLKVNVGHLLPKHRLVPADQAQPQGDAVRVPYTLDTIEESPHVDSGDTLEGEDLDEVRAYYQSALAGTPAETDTATADNGGSDDDGSSPTQVVSEIPLEAAPDDLGKVRDLGDVIEVPIVEEVLVRKPVVREVLRVKKSQLTDQQVVEADLRREDVEVLPSDPALIRDGDSEGDT